jgi:hypothetical protein
MAINYDSDGGKVLDRIIEAYGFSSKQSYTEYLGVSASSLSMRYKRDSFPYDLVIKCMDETGATLEWLANGEGEFLPTEKQPKETILSDDTLEKLERLAALKKEGAITEQEFNALKAKLI